jgi:hypothetical protein
VPEGVVDDGCAVGRGEVSVHIPGVGVEAVGQQIAVGIVSDLVGNGVVAVGGIGVAGQAAPKNAAALGNVTEGVVKVGQTALLFLPTTKRSKS